MFLKVSGAAYLPGVKILGSHKVEYHKNSSKTLCFQEDMERGAFGAPESLWYQKAMPNGSIISRFSSYFFVSRYQK